MIIITRQKLTTLALKIEATYIKNCYLVIICFVIDYYKVAKNNHTLEGSLID